MQPNLLMAIILPVFISCIGPVNPASVNSSSEEPGNVNPYSSIAAIPLPNGYSRLSLPPHSFGAWLRALPLKQDKTVYLYNGQRKPYQQAQFAVIDISTGTKDLQQCADAIMRLRAEYLHASGRDGEIVFKDNSGKAYVCPPHATRSQFDRYLEKVFSWCGTLSLEKQLTQKNTLSTIEPGDVFIKGGSPGHAAIVMDVAVNNKGQRIFLLANSYMPAQDIHVVLNPTDSGLNPWYSTENKKTLEIPEWTFLPSQLRGW